MFPLDNTEVLSSPFEKGERSLERVRAVCGALTQMFALLVKELECARSKGAMQWKREIESKQATLS